MRLLKTIISQMASVVFACLALGLFTSASRANDIVTFRSDDKPFTLTGRVLVEAQDGGLLFQGRDGAIYNIESDDLLQKSSDETPFEPMTQEEIAASVLAELPEGFEAYTTAHYVICHKTSPAYARWCGGLFERLAAAFDNYWSRVPRSLETHEPEFPLVAIAFPDKESYVSFAEAEVGAAAESMIGYFSQRTNRVVMYDLTAAASSVDRGRISEREIVRILSQHNGGLTIATVIHEATHQIAFNSGVQIRFADNPVWLTEGMAMYFETPDLRSRSGWRTIGAVNKPRLAGLKNQLAEWNATDLETMIASDDLFRQTETARVAYDAAWALNYFLAKRQNKAYCDFLKVHAAKERLNWDTPESRVETFEAHFGEIEQLNAEFVRYFQRMR